MTALGVNLFLGARVYLHSEEVNRQNDVYKQLRLFAQVLTRVAEDYVDRDKVSYEALIRGALRGMLASLDPHSEFLEPKRFEDLRHDTEGKFGGVGIQIGVRKGVLTVIAPIEDTPAYRAGVLSGDQIIRIGDRSTEGFTPADAAELLRGKPGTKVTFTIRRPSTGEVRDITVKRAHIRVASVRDIHGESRFPVGEDGIGYVRINQFAERTADELSRALDKLQEAGMRALVLDLRDNPGGLLDQAAQVCGRFLPPGTLVVTTEGPDPEDHREFRVPRSGPHLDVPMAVLVNGGSASASEIVAGCLQDLHRAVIVGEQTFGKGSVQSVIPLQDGAALRLTTAKYYTPSHRVIHEKGITPDIVVPVSAEDLNALALKRIPGAIETLEPERRRQVEAVRDVQLERARDLLKGMLLLSERRNAQAAPARDQG
ncbi:MAG: S41 family peptidase [Verrucomicrobia bacterium]|nr:MAG: S41 family peptidase [Verrucomicrobiota bacterium]